MNKSATTEKLWQLLRNQ